MLAAAKWRQRASDLILMVEHTAAYAEALLWGVVAASKDPTLRVNAQPLFTLEIRRGSAAKGIAL